MPPPKFVQTMFRQIKRICSTSPNELDEFAIYRQAREATLVPHPLFLTAPPAAALAFSYFSGFGAVPLFFCAVAGTSYYVNQVIDSWPKISAWTTGFRRLEAERLFKKSIRYTVAAFGALVLGETLVLDLPWHSPKVIPNSAEPAICKAVSRGETIFKVDYKQWPLGGTHLDLSLGLPSKPVKDGAGATVREVRVYLEQLTHWGFPAFSSPRVAAFNWHRLGTVRSDYFAIECVTPPKGWNGEQQVLSRPPARPEEVPSKRAGLG